MAWFRNDITVAVIGLVNDEAESHWLAYDVGDGLKTKPYTFKLLSHMLRCLEA